MNVVGLLVTFIFLELAGVAAVLAFECAGWRGALLAPGFVLVLWIGLLQWVDVRIRKGRPPNE